jgi:hypothetical protein
MQSPLESVAQLVAQLDSADIRENECVLVLVAEQSSRLVPEMCTNLGRLPVKFVGGVFPALIVNDKIFTSGILWKKLPLACEPLFFSDLKKGFELPQDFVMPQKLLSGRRACTAFGVIDGSSPFISGFLSELYDFFGDSCSYIGAGAGQWASDNRQCVFSEAGFIADAGFLLILDWEAKVAIAHGFEPCSKAMLATMVENHSLLKTIDWRPAFEVYSDIIVADSGKILNTENLREIGRVYPFGIFRENAESIVREPLGINADGSIRLGGGITGNAVIQVMRGRQEGLLRAAENVLWQIRPENEAVVVDAMIVDCISRHDYLDKDFAVELEILYQGIVLAGLNTVYGVLSVGELASASLDGFLDMHNKTLALAYFFK